MKRFFLLLFLMMMMLGSCSASSVVAVGMGDSENAALHNAMRLAVEQQVGVLLDAETVVQNTQLLNDRIYTRTEGYITSYEILSQNYQTGEYQVKIRAEVSAQLASDLMTKLQKRKMIDVNMGDPRIAVLVYDRRGNEDQEAENALLEKLQVNGFNRLVDLSQLAQSTKYHIANAAFQNQFDEVQALQQQFKADYVVMAKIAVANASRAMSDGYGNFYSGHASLAVRIYNVNDGEIAFAGNAMGTALHADEELAERTAVNKAAESVAVRLSNAMVRKAANPEQHIQVFVTNKEQVSRVREQIMKLPNVTGAFPRSFMYGMAILDVNFCGTSADFAAELENQGIPILEMTSEYVKI